mgnify:CR=1 FL=1
MKSNPSKLVELQATIPVPPDGVTAKQLLRSLKHLADGITDQYTEPSKSVPIDAPYYLLSITVSAIGEPPTNESSISTTPPGDSLQIDPFPWDSFKRLSDRVDGLERWQSAHEHLHDRQKEPAAIDYSRIRQLLEDESEDEDELLEDAVLTLQWNPAWQHPFNGLNGNCKTCNMPRLSRQHMRTDNAPITRHDEERAVAWITAREIDRQP